MTGFRQSMALADTSTQPVSAKSVPVKPMSKEIIPKRTETTKTFDNGDGTYTVKLFSSPIHFLNKGVWQDVDPAIKPSGDGNYENGNGRFKARFAGNGKANELTSFEYDGMEVAYSLASLPDLGPNYYTIVNESMPEVKGNSLKYADIFPGVDLRQVVTGIGIKEDIILRQYNDKNSFAFLLKLNGVNAVKETDGSIDFYKNGQKNKVFTIPKPFMIDSKLDRVSGQGARSDNVVLGVTQQGSNILVTITADKQWLTSPERQFPIYIDPTTTLTAGQDTFVSNQSPNTNFNAHWNTAGYYELKTQKYFNPDKYTHYISNSFLNFSASSLNGKLVTSAKLNIYDAESSGNLDTNVNSIGVNKVNGSWDETSLTFANSPGSSLLLTGNAQSNVWSTFDVCSTVGGWLSDPAKFPNYGFELTDNTVPPPDQYGYSYVDSFYASENSTNQPYLSVTYSDKPTVPTGTAFGNSANSATGYTNLTWAPVSGATGYKVAVFNGSSYEYWDVGNVTSWSTQNKGIWPTASEISAGRYSLHHDGSGAELADDPQPVYTNAGGSYANNHNYWFKLKAYNANGETSESEPLSLYLPENIPTGLGLDHWGTVDNHVGKVNIANGNFVVSETDIKLPGRGLGTNFTRIYNSQAKRNGDLGWGWHIDVPELGQYSDGSIVIIEGHGSKHTYTVNADGSYTRPAGDYDILTKNADGTFTLKSKDGSKYVLDTGNRKVTHSDKNNNTVVYQYDNNNRLISITDPTNRVTSLTYDATTGKLTSIKDYASRTWSYAYDANDNLIKVTDPLNYTEAFAYDSNHQLTSETDARGNTTNLTYTGNKLTGVTDPAPLSNNTSYIYDGTNKLFMVTDAKGYATKYWYDTNWNITSITDVQNNTTSYTYDTDFNELTKTDALARMITYTHDSMGNKLTETDSLNHKTTDTYDADNNVLTKTDALGTVTNYTYDANGNQLIDSLAGTVNTYNADGTLATSRDANGNITTYVYESNGNLTKVTDALGKVTQYDYDSMGNKTRETDANGNTTSFTYDTLGRMLAVTVPDSSGSTKTTTYTYDGNGNRLSSTDAAGNVTTWTYDAINRVLSITEPGNHTKSVTYDYKGNVLSETAADSTVTRYTYDNLYRQTQVAYPDGKVVSYTYDSVGNRTSLADSTGTTAYEYDKDNNLSKETAPTGKVSTFTYDATNKLTGKSVNGQTATTFTYDNQDNLTILVDANNLTTSFSYDANKNRTAINYANSTKINYGYDATDKISSVQNLGPTGNVLFNYSYAYYDNGQLKTVTDSKGITTYVYDGQHRLTQITYPNGDTTAYAYDAVGNRTLEANKVNGINLTTSYTFDSATNELTKVTNPDGTSISYTYDANGNTLTKADSTGTTKYEYNSNNQLTKITKPNGDVIQYSYNGDNKRISKTRNGVITKYVYDENQVSEATDSSGNVLATYFYDNQGIPVSVTEGGKTYNYHYNGHGDVVALTDFSGTVVATYAYDVWGNVTTKTGSVDSLFGYAGQFGYVYDQETGLYFLQSRYYDPGIGRFTTKDRFIGFVESPASQNLFTYGENDPVNAVDPDGSIARVVFYWWGIKVRLEHSDCDWIWNKGMAGVSFTLAPIAALLGGGWVAILTVYIGAHIGLIEWNDWGNGVYLIHYWWALPYSWGVIPRMWGQW